MIVNRLYNLIGNIQFDHRALHNELQYPVQLPVMNNNRRSIDIPDSDPKCMNN